MYLKFSKRIAFFLWSQSLYRIINFRDVIPVHVSAVWSLKIHPRVHFFLWLLAKNKLLTRDNLSFRKSLEDVSCLFCSEDESVHHCRYPGTGVPLLLRLGKDSRSYPKLRAEEQSSRTPAVRSPPRRASGPGPALCSGEGPVTPCVPEKTTPGANSRGPRAPCHPDPPARGEPAFHPGGVRCRHVSAGAGTSLPPEDSPAHRI